MHICFIKNIQEVEILIQSFMIYLKFWNSKMLNHLKDNVGGQNLSFYVGLRTPFTNNNASEEEKVLEKAP